MAEQRNTNPESFRRRLFDQYINTLMQPNVSPPPPSVSSSEVLTAQALRTQALTAQAALARETLARETLARETLARERISRSLSLSARSALARERMAASASALSARPPIRRERTMPLTSPYLGPPLLGMDQLRHQLNTYSVPGSLNNVRDTVQNNVPIADLASRSADMLRNAAIARQNSPVMGPSSGEYSQGDDTKVPAATKNNEQVDEASGLAGYACGITHSAGTRDGLLYIDQIQDLDVLCGRGGKSNHHPGNKMYRQVVNEMKQKYKNIEGKSAKTDLSRAIVDHVCNYGGRFVKKDETTGHYYLVSLAEARKKTSQALRESKSLKWIE